MSIEWSTMAGTLVRGTIAEILETGELIVSTENPPGRVLCDFLQSGAAPGGANIVLSPGDPVIFMAPAAPTDKGVVMGRVGPYLPPDLEHLTLQAGATLTLRCGPASVTLRNDGKILTRGVDIATIANRTHRIKGGSVEIN
jgi:hypothetical protein